MAGERKPEFIIIAGPNGAGKSSRSHDFVKDGTFIFNPDQEDLNLKTIKPKISSVDLFDQLKERFSDYVQDAIRNRKDFAMETNFRDNELLPFVDKFQQYGYSTQMVFLALGNVQKSIQRVASRFSQGGHHVDNISIDYNFIAGLRNLVLYADQFDMIKVYNASTNKLVRLLELDRENVLFKAKKIPEELRSTIDKLIENHERSRNQNNPGYGF